MVINKWTFVRMIITMVCLYFCVDFFYKHLTAKNKCDASGGLLIEGRCLDASVIRFMEK